MKLFLVIITFRNNHYWRKRLFSLKVTSFFAINNTDCYCISALWYLLIKNAITPDLSIRHGLFVVVAWHYQKTNTMKQKAINQEILLITGTSFCSRQFIKRDDDSNEGRDHSTMEELEKACWDGMLNELLPELADYPSHGNRNFIWNIVSGVHFLCISMGPCPMPEKNEMSVDPYFFMLSACEN